MITSTALATTTTQPTYPQIPLPVAHEMATSAPPAIRNATPDAGSPRTRRGRPCWLMRASNLRRFCPASSLEDGVDGLLQGARLRRLAGSLFPGVEDVGAQLLESFASQALPHFGKPVVFLFLHVVANTFD